jgi:hypothetical protein
LARVRRIATLLSYVQAGSTGNLDETQVYVKR